MNKEILFIRKNTDFQVYNIYISRRRRNINKDTISCIENRVDRRLSGRRLTGLFD